MQRPWSEQFPWHCSIGTVASDEIDGPSGIEREQVPALIPYQVKSSQVKSSIKNKRATRPQRQSVFRVVHCSGWSVPCESIQLTFSQRPSGLCFVW